MSQGIRLLRGTRPQHTANSSIFYNGEITAVTTANGVCTGELRIHNENFLGGIPVGNMALTQTVLEGGRISHLREARTIVDLGTINTRDLILQKGTDQLVIPANNVGIFKSDELTPIVEETNTKVTIKNVSIDLSNDTGAIIVPKGTTAQRPATPTAGMIRYNTTLQQYEIYSESIVPAVWSKIGDMPPEVTSVSPQFPDFGNNTTSFVISGNNFDQGSTVIFIGNDNSEITPLTVTFNTATQLTAVANTFQFDFTKEPYDLKITKAGGLSAIFENAIYVDTKPTWSLTDSTTLATIYGIYRDQGVEVTLPTSTDPDGDTVTYGAVNLPTGLSIDSTTGVITGLTESVTEYTTSNFTVQAKSTSGDAQNLGEQITSRTVNIVRTSEVLNSLRFDGSSYLSRTVTSGNRREYTLSMWLKFAISSASNTGDVTLFGQGNGTNDTLMLVQGTADKFWFLDRNGTTSYYQAPGNINDISAWYHVVYVIDTPNSSSNSDPPASTDRVRIYINGTQQLLSMVTGGTSQLAVDHDTQINNTTYSTAYISRNPWSGGYFSGYMANIQFIDGQALGPSNFGQNVDGMWVPKQYSGSGYGVNGFHLDFSPDNLVFNGNALQTVKDIAPIDGTHTTANDWAAN
jgi:hypothetical protein